MGRGRDADIRGLACMERGRERGAGCVVAGLGREAGREGVREGAESKINGDGKREREREIGK